MIDDWGVREHRDIYAEVLPTWGFPPPGSTIVPAHAKTNASAQVDRLLKASEAAEALAMMHSFAFGVRLNEGSSDWTMSCLPQYSDAPNQRRATTITIGRNEVFHVWMYLDTGRIGDWGMLVGERDDEDNFGELSTIIELEKTRHGLLAKGSGFDSFAEALGHQLIRKCAENVIQNRRKAGSKRQGEWHNPRLARLLELDTAGKSEEAEIIESDWDVPISYAMGSIASRRHQAAFRRNLLKNTVPVACAVCGIDVKEILEAAHLIPDSQGGRASADNAILLCANHHKSMDQKMFTWTAGAPQWKPGIKPF
ncbi:HNH endonuclease [Paeniglutamicibacter terrestris]|uniref:HNH nuclease domain-containing protein n=1 Tax=Paeniglutamicibacter terrestris TaxID=2723403 RepID=A0ABX1G8L4_9MICC|nr:HNH endonuclease [Paeniglutamicibacter terrestris]NKG22587.1 hypothetical protein [Paeniglutamicibacter terrestris]